MYPEADFVLLHSVFARQATACTVSIVPDGNLMRSQLRGDADARISHDCAPPETLYSVTPGLFGDGSRMAVTLFVDFGFTITLNGAEIFR